MPLRIEDYAIIGNQETAALVGRDGSIDWLCLPRFDSAACFSALLGGPEHGRWLIAPAEGDVEITRRYLDKTLVLETLFRTPRGAVALTDFMYRRDGSSELVRIVRGVEGEVAMRTELVVRFDYGAVVPWVSQQEDGRLQFIAGPDRLLLQTPIPTRGEDMRTVGDFTIRQGEEVSFVLNWSPSFRAALPPLSGEDLAEACEQIHRFWTGWSATFQSPEPWADAVLRSLLTLKALAHWETGGIVAAPTTSLPEQLGGPRNWDYRFCWLRDATFTLYALIGAGVLEEAKAWHEWLLRAVAGSPNDLQIVYGVAGERRLEEYEIPWLPGYEGSAPVRIGNGAVGQLQLDVYGEVLDAFYVARRAGIATSDATWALGMRPSRASRSDLAGARRGHLGSARRPAALHPLEGDGVGRVRSRGAFDRGIRSRRARSSAGATSATQSMRRCARSGFDADAKHLHPVLRRCGAGREPAAHPDGRLPAAGRSARPGHGRGDRAQAAARRIGAALRHGERRRRPAAGGGRVSRLQLLARRQLRAARAATTRRALCSSGCSALRNDVGLARGGIRSARASGSSATSRRLSRISR